MMNIGQALQNVIVLHGERKLLEAENLLWQILEVEPENPDANHFIGIIAYEVGNFEYAENYLKKAIQLNPSNPSCYLNMGNLVQTMGDLEGSLKWYEKSMATGHQESEKIYNNMGVSLTRLSRYEDATASLEKAVGINSQYAEAWNNLSEVYKLSGRFDDAVNACDKAIQLAPQMVSARWNRALLYLLKADFENGWPAYEWRWKRPQTPSRAIDAGERWAGQPLDGKTIFVYEEQGMGDTLQFMRYLPMVQQLGGKVIFEVIPPLIRLADTVAGYDRLWVGQKNVDTRPTDRFDFHVPLMSLPGILGTNLSNIPASLPYIRTDQTLAKIWGARIKDVPGLKVGVVWAGHPQHNNDHNRSIPLSLIASLAESENISLYCLQKDKHKKWMDMDPATVFVQDLGAQIADFADTAAVIENLDLVVSVDTAMVHLAGAMWKPVWTLLPISPDWRWMLEREDSPWYPSMKLFRQTTAGDWASVIENVKSALEQFAKDSR